MAVSTTATTTYTRDELIALGAKAAGLLNAQATLSPDALAFAASMLALSLQDLQTKGLVMRATDRYTLTLTAAQSYADMPADTISIEEGITIRTLDGLQELPVALYGRSAYQAQPSKTVQGRPSYCYPEQATGGTWRLNFWPVPTSDWVTAIVPRGKRMRDIATGNINIDLDPKWLKTIVFIIGADLARHFNSPGKASQMQALADRHLADCLGDEHTHGTIQLIAPSAGWD